MDATHSHILSCVLCPKLHCRNVIILATGHPTTYVNILGFVALGRIDLDDREVVSLQPVGVVLQPLVLQVQRSSDVLVLVPGDARQASRLDVVISVVFALE